MKKFTKYSIGIGSGFLILGLVGGFAASTSTTTLNLPMNPVALSATSMKAPSTAEWGTLGLSSAQGLASKLVLTYSSLTHKVRGSFIAGGKRSAFIADEVTSFTANTSHGAVINLNVQGSLDWGHRTTPVLLAAEFIPGTDKMQGTLTIEGLSSPAHLPLGTPFITPAMAQQINQAATTH